MTIIEMRDKRAKLLATMDGFLDTHRNDKGVLSAEDDATYAGMEKDLAALTNEIKRMERREAIDAELSKPVSAPITNQPMSGAKPTDKGKTGRAADDYKANFWNVMRSKMPLPQVVNALQVGDDAEGGYWSRKQGLLELAKAEGKSIGDLSLQLDYIWKELSEGYGKLLKTLQTTTSVIEASTAVLTQYERPADMGEAVQAKRAGYAQTYFDKYAPKPTHPERLTEGYYRVRKTWADKKSQLGAYRILSNAKKKADANSGYFVFTEEGTAIYSAVCEPEKAPVKEETHVVHTVVPGDTLWKISERYLGKGIRYKEIKALNGLTSDTIYRGMKLKIPN